MNIIEINNRITRIQNRLFEQAHTQSLELKPVAIALNKQGIKAGKLYCNPGMIPLPMLFSEYLRSLNTSQKSILSAAFFANFYKYIANSESQAIVSNMNVSDKLFAPYSDEYMVLHQETNEELDHIWSFRTIHKMVCREIGIQDSFDEPGFFYGSFRPVPQSDWENLNTSFTFDVDLSKTLSHLKKGKTFLNQLIEQMELQGRNWLYRTLRFMIGDAIRMLPAEIVQENGLGSLWLLYRYMANIELKQAESYLFDDPENFDYDPLAFELNQAHITDEARHYTTSFDLGFELYQKAPPEAQDFIRYAMQKIVEDYINASFTTYLEKLDLNNQGIVLTDTRLGINSLCMSLQHPEFVNKPVEMNELIHSWRDMSLSWRKIIGPLEQKSWRYRAQQIARLLQALELELSQEFLGNRYNRYQDALGTKEIQRLIEVA
ncbi:MULTISPECIES: hypothetical protein [unclassified Nodularia (in: cyanobacteria)]|uniref:hypothetical protein n=1 Tax=unclassified Nodularia (in: cyanobacteria) TaxID=2656917 RepID=UPI00187FF1AE|nr:MULTISPECIES: hypothetical protein [unclassified Nodularia (in: cyanobacteria)]MBE9200004.1 hypothetical protein [Nodularia sp. LEGE 06071]MCC2695290.1 hypothetical protein [Nodularia sp. LEGE 04288]